MKRAFKTLNFGMERKLSPSHLGIPGGSYSHLLLQNQNFERIRATWEEADDIISQEYTFLKRLERLEMSKDFEKEFEVISDEINKDETLPFCGLDLGIAGTVFALSALKAVPYWSCNGGMFGDYHTGDRPNVAFFAKQTDRLLLLRAVEKAGISIISARGQIEVWSNDIWKMHHFSKIVWELNKEKKRKETAKK